MSKKRRNLGFLGKIYIPGNRRRFLFKQERLSAVFFIVGQKVRLFLLKWEEKMERRNKKPRLFSGIQPTGNLTIGNYAGAIRNWVKLQDEYFCIFSLVDLHAITVDQNPVEFRRKSYDFLALYMACGIDPEKSIIFVQSHNPTHAELTWILNCFTYLGELNRMTQFKEKSTKHPQNVNAGLFDYPVLMAADILLYETDLVPVGEDQKQHVEIARDIALRFNRKYGQTFRVPRHFIPKTGARIKNLLDPARKMDKSNKNPKTYIGLLDSPDEIVQKIKGAVTGSAREYIIDDETSGIANLVTLMSVVTDKSKKDVAEEYSGRGYVYFKKKLSERIIEFLKPIQNKYQTLRQNEDRINRIIKDGAAKAYSLSRNVLKRVYDKIGFIPR